MLFIKGQLISEWIFGVFKSSKKPTKFLTDFCPSSYSPKIPFHKKNTTGLYQKDFDCSKSGLANKHHCLTVSMSQWQEEKTLMKGLLLSYGNTVYGVSRPRIKNQLYFYHSRSLQRTDQRALVLTLRFLALKKLVIVWP